MFKNACLTCKGSSILIVLDEYFANTVAFISKMIDDAVNHSIELRREATKENRNEYKVLSGVPTRDIDTSTA